MVPRGRIGEGLILVFNNGLKNRFGYRRSSILAIDPVEESILWEYHGRFFYSSLSGTQQSLPNGNVLITSSHGGRVFEVTPSQEMVWQWIPPWDPMRVERYAPDHCRQLKSLHRRDLRAVPPQRRWPYISQELHTFAVSGEYRHLEVAGRIRQVVKDPSSCRQMVLPAQPALSVGFGIDPTAPGAEGVTARLTITLESVDSGQITTLLDQTASSDDEELWHQPWIPVSGHDFRTVLLCLSLNTPHGNGNAPNHPAAVIENPRFYAGDHPQPPRRPEEELSEQEKQLREEQLRAIGYIQ
jgi:hypothetical protein